MASDRKTKSVKAESKNASPRKAAKSSASEEPAPQKTRTKRAATQGPSGETGQKQTKTPKPKKKTAPVASKAAAKPKKAASPKPTKAPPMPKAPPKPPKPRKPKVDPELLRAIRDALVHQRNSLMSVVQSTQAQLAQKAVDLADISDRASGGYEDDLAMGLMKIEAAKIDDIEAAIKRIDEDVYGICADCQKVIPRKRLEVLPFALRCLACEGTKERRARMHIPSDDADD